MQAEVARTDLNKELGGLLIRTRRAEQGTIRIVDYVPLATPGTTTQFHLPSDSLAETIARCPSDYTIAGFFRTDLDRRIVLRSEDQETMRSWFRGPANVCLVIAVEETDRATAGFFCWEDQTIGPESHLSFPFSVHKLSDPRWPKQGDFREKRSIFKTLASSDWSLQRAIRQASTVAIFAVLSLLLLLAIGIRVALWYLPRPATNLTQSTSFGLTVQKQGRAFLVHWDPAVPEIKAAKEANLVVWDTGMTNADGTIKPIFIGLHSAQLHLGSFVYDPISLSDRIKFRLEVMDTRGSWASQSVTALDHGLAGSGTSKP